MEQMLGSIRGYFYSKWPVTVYTKSIPEKIVTPCIYFPPPRTFDTVYTKSGFEVTYLLSIKIFHKTSSDALLQAENIAMSIRANKWTLPLLFEDGTVASEKIRFTRLECSIIEDNVASINLQWTKYYSFDS